MTTRDAFATWRPSDCNFVDQRQVIVRRPRAIDPLCHRSGFAAANVILMPSVPHSGRVMNDEAVAASFTKFPENTVEVNFDSAWA